MSCLIIGTSSGGRVGHGGFAFVLLESSWVVSLNKQCWRVLGTQSEQWQREGESGQASKHEVRIKSHC